ncbi:MAG TPA: hypothetical protein VJS63_17315 [Bradyrhizobium sp.]|nr:hypothetical protein [Bradyrhizobium sp.]
MFKRPVVIIVGAGAGFEYRMPLGSKLASDIADAVRFRFEHFSRTPTNGDPSLFNLLFRRFQQDLTTLNRFTQAGNDLASTITAAVSVDDALYQLSENATAVTLGKMAIFQTILRAEAGSSLKFSRETGRIDEAAGRNDWIEALFSMAIAGLKKSELRSAFQNVTFISFNYDRCIEHYLYWAFQRIGVDSVQAAEVVECLNMIRPYGGLGPVLPNTNGRIEFGFGGHLDPYEILDRIRTYTESSIHDGARLKGALHDAHLIIFLGFGFHPQNLELLRLDQPRTAHVMATVKNIHPANLDALNTALGKALRVSPEAIELFDMTTAEMLRGLRLMISMRASS